MNSERWHEVDELLRRVLDLPSAQRSGFLARETKDDGELRSAVEDMLRAVEEAGPFLEGSVEDLWDLPWQDLLPAPAPGRAAPIETEEAAFDRSGERLGAYRLLRRLGRGGMATVYLAERADGLWEQQVAVKILRRGLDTEDVVRRFHAERQILSSLDHPNVARLLDGGSTPDGLPYLVMEYVEGTPITRYCDEHGLSIGARLRLFQDVAAAVQRAHRHLVVHRDLKPSNILVDDEGRVKLLDFGIAKILDPTLEGDPTRTAARPLTLAYASPEQVTGAAVTTASDVYQLGLLLCELLAGRRPYEVTSLSPARRERRILEAEPARPSDLVTPEAAARRSTDPKLLAARLRGDLDTIVLHALRKEPEARFESVASLLDDVGRHLRGEPVSVQPATMAYRASKFIRRHRAGVAAAVLVVLLLGVSAAVSLVQARHATRQRDRARAEAARAEQVTGFISDLFGATDPNEAGGDTITAIELLDIGADRALENLEGDPRTQAAILSEIGSIYIARGLFDRARPLIERSIAFRRSTGADTAALIVDLRQLGTVIGRNDPEAGNRVLAEAVDLAEAYLPPDDPRLAMALVDRADGIRMSPATERSETWAGMLDRAIAILRAADGDVRAELARALQLRAYAGDDAGTPENYEMLEESLELRRSLYGENHTSVAATLNDMALAVQMRDPRAADTLLERAIEINQRIVGPDHAHTIQMMSNLAGRWRDRGECAKAEAMYRELLRRRRRAYPADSVGHAFIMHGLAWCLTEQGRPDEAEPLLREVLGILANAGFDTSSPVFQMGRSTLGRSLAEQGRFAEAEPLLRDSYEWMRENAPRPVFLQFMGQRLVELYEDWGRPEAAERYANREGASSNLRPPPE
ncbi:MAG: serine/threonine-protein kinase [Gemmatimonadales bacterium]